MKKNGLGKGLSSLIPNYNEPSSFKNDIKKTDFNYVDIDINLIQPNINQPRKFFDDDNIQDLSQSIKNHGIIQPLIVSEVDGKYLIVAGERRFRASKLLGFKKLPCIVVEKSNQEIIEISLIENIQREDLNPIEEAKAFKNLLNNFNISQEDLSKRLSISRSAISNKIRLLKLCNVVQEYVLNEEISEGHARVLVGIKDESLQIEISNKIIDEDLSVRQTEKLIQSLNKPKNEITNTIIKNSHPYIINLKSKLENYFGTKVLINDKKNKGNIQIEYYSNEDLNRILGLIYNND